MERAQTTDTADILRFFFLQTLARASIRKRLWIGAGAVAIFIGTIAVGYLLTPKPAKTHEAIGYDFIAFYTAGRFILDGRTRELYDLRVVATFQHELALQNGTDLGTAIGPYWNPPFYAWTFVPLAKLSFPAAMKTWVLFNLLCVAASAIPLCQIIRRSARQSPQGAVRSTFSAWALIPVLLVLSTPFIHALSHAQNTCTSLLILTTTVVLWRAKRALLAGAVGGLLFYKPQLGAVLATVLVLDLGMPAFIGLASVGIALLALSLTLPGMMYGFLHQMPANLHFVQDQVPYLWERHVTFKAFWRLLFQGSVAGNPTRLVSLLSWTCSGWVGASLLWAIIRGRGTSGQGLVGSALRTVSPLSRIASPAPGPNPTPQIAIASPMSEMVRRADPTRSNCPASIATLDEITRRDRVIAATVAATPLLMPFYFDYDQLLLAIPAVLLAGEFLRRGMSASTADRWLVRIWPVHFVWLMINPDVALLTRVNLTVPLLAAVCMLLIARAGRREQAVSEITARADADKIVAAAA